MSESIVRVVGVCFPKMISEMRFVAKTAVEIEEQVHQITTHTAWIHASLMNGMWNLYGIMLKLAEKLSASHTPLFSFCCWHFAACSLCMMLKLILWYIECLHWAHCITHHKHITHHPTDSLMNEKLIVPLKIYSEHSVLIQFMRTTFSPA